MTSQEDDGKNPKNDMFERNYQIIVLGHDTDVCEVFAGIHRCLWRFVVIELVTAAPMSGLRKLHTANRRI
ncbi:hypothetical protein [Pandoraea sputorum]|uniref:hypothetical protein n=1 Tax=Pandoraea sputorum TaxID=93222 RepID=UPI00124197FD|nr:hypothetical protein [Pandoraea sputorum]